MKRHVGSEEDRTVIPENVSVFKSPGWVKRSITYLLEREMAKQHITRAELARRMETSRAVVNRLLDPEHLSLTLHTLEKAAEALGKELIIDLR